MTSLNSQLFHLPELKVSIIFVERERGIFALFYANLTVCKCQDALLKGAKTLSSSSDNRCKQPAPVLAPMLIHSWILFENKTTLIPCDCHGIE